MPIYEYQCLECGIHFDRLQRFGDPAPDACPKGHGRVHRVLSQPAIIFKGSGFYVTDHGRNGRHGSSAKMGRQSRDTESASSDRKEEKAQ
jgi:putative FmdB family regulatory protein